MLFFSNRTKGEGGCGGGGMAHDRQKEDDFRIKISALEGVRGKERDKGKENKIVAANSLSFFT